MQCEHEDTQLNKRQAAAAFANFKVEVVSVCKYKRKPFPHFVGEYSRPIAITILLQLEPNLISHVFIGINDFARALNFYSAIMGELGLLLKFSEPEKSWAGWVAPDASRPLFLIGKPYDDRPASAGNGQMVALLCATRAIVDRVHDAALSMGAACEGLPGLRPHYHANFYGAYFRDLDDNKICICCHEPVGI